MDTPESVLKSWVDDYVDVYNKDPTKEMLDLWKYRIWELHFNEDNE